MSQAQFPGKRPFHTKQHQLSPSTTSTFLSVLLVARPVAHERWDPLSWSLCVIQHRKIQVFSTKLLIIPEYFLDYSQMEDKGSETKNKLKGVQMLRKCRGKMLNLLRN